MDSFWDFIPTILQVGATIYGASQKSAADNKAASTLTAANQAGTAAQIAGLNTAAGVTAGNQAAASPGLVAGCSCNGRRHHRPQYGHLRAAEPEQCQCRCWAAYRTIFRCRKQSGLDSGSDWWRRQHRSHKYRHHQFQQPDRSRKPVWAGHR